MKKNKLFKATIIDLGRSKICKEFFFNKTSELREEIQKHLASKGWDLEETETTDRFKVTAGCRIVGTILIKEVKSI